MFNIYKDLYSHIPVWNPFRRDEVLVELHSGISSRHFHLLVKDTPRKVQTRKVSQDYHGRWVYMSEESGQNREWKRVRGKKGDHIQTL